MGRGQTFTYRSDLGEGVDPRGQKSVRRLSSEAGGDYCVLPLTAAAALLLSSGVETNNHASAAEVSKIPGQVRVQTLRRKQHLQEIR